MALKTVNNVCMYVCVYVCMHVCIIYVCMYLCMCMYVCMYVCIYVYTYMSLKIVNNVCMYNSKSIHFNSIYYCLYTVHSSYTVSYLLNEILNCTRLTNSPQSKHHHKCLLHWTRWLGWPNWPWINQSSALHAVITRMWDIATYYHKLSHSVLSNWYVNCFSVPVQWKEGRKCYN